MTDQDYGATVRLWVDVVRRARLDKTTKLVAFAIAHYADGDGTRIFPGIARLSYECDLGYNAIQNTLRKLRAAELIEVVSHGNRPGRADEYRLILGENTYERIEVPDPSTATKAIQALQEAHRRRPKSKPGPSVHPSGDGVPDSTEPVDNPVDGHSVHPAASGVPDEGSEDRTPLLAMHTEAGTPLLEVSVHPSRSGATNHYQNTTTTTHKTADLTTAVTVPRARTPEDQISDPENQTRGRHAAAENDEPEPAGNVIPFPKARAS